jgi:hypothetical protein
LGKLHHPNIVGDPLHDFTLTRTGNALGSVSYMAQTYNPNHPMPSPEVEASMKAPGLLWAGGFVSSARRPQRRCGARTGPYFLRGGSHCRTWLARSRAGEVPQLSAGCVKHFLSKHRASVLSAKRGGGAEHVPLVHETDTAPGLPLPGKPDDELGLDREWAFVLIARALNSLEQEHAHKTEFFAALKPRLDGGATASQAEAAFALEMSETAVKVAIHRLRAHFRELIRAEITATVNDPAGVADELHHLIAVAGSSSDHPAAVTREPS